jgi:hypothetical protein
MIHPTFLWVGRKLVTRDMQCSAQLSWVGTAWYGSRAGDAQVTGACARVLTAPTRPCHAFVWASEAISSCSCPLVVKEGHHNCHYMASCVL